MFLNLALLAVSVPDYDISRYNGLRYNGLSKEDQFQLKRSPASYRQSANTC